MLLGQLAVKEFGIDESYIDRALSIQKKIYSPIGQILIQLGAITENQLYAALSKQLGLPLLSYEDIQIDPETVNLLPPAEVEYLIKNRTLPVSQTDSSVTVITSNQLNSHTHTRIKKFFNKKLRINLVTEKTFDRISQDILSLTATGRDIVRLDLDTPADKLKELAFEAPVIKYLNNIIGRAIELKASDIHIEPSGGGFRVRFRIDGILYEVDQLEEGFYLALVSRIKLISSLDIAERKLPQDGKFSTRISSSVVDIRVSTIPMVDGEGVVMRLLYREKLSFDIKALGIEKDHIELLLKTVTKPFGMFLITGPTGSGKTTTLYSLLTVLNSPEKKIITVEDPVEYRLAGINQIQVKPEVGLTFASALRSILRHDPDIIMVGEIRDSETAAIAVQSALTGHFVLSTLHTNDSVSALSRLVDMKVEDYLVNASVVALSAQRIVRKLCDACKKPLNLSREVVLEYGINSLIEKYSGLLEDGIKTYRAEGCRLCGGTGYRGRVAIFEIFEYTEDLKQEFIKSHSVENIRNILKEKGFRTIREDGIIKVLKGITTLEEVLRVS